MCGPGSRVACFTLSCLVALLLAASGADARERQQRAKSGQVHRSVTRTGADGTSGTSTHDTTWQRGGGKYSRDTVHTGPGGKQATTHVEGAKTQDGRVRDVTRTGPGGKTSTTHDELHRTESGYTRETTHTGPNGGVTTRSATGSYDAETKTWTRDATTTRSDGSTATSHSERTRTEDGYQRSATHTGPQGTTSVEGQGTWDPETKTWTREKLVTRPDGSTSKTEVTTQFTPGAPEPAPAE
jgi:hypothetical protein